MTVRTCGQCNAPLPDGNFGDTLRCEFCGAVNEAAKIKPQPSSSSLGEVRKPTKPTVFLGVFVAMVGIACVTLAIKHHLNKALQEQAEETKIRDAKASARALAPSSPPTAPTPPEEKKIPVAELSRAPLDVQQEIDAPPLPSEMSRFDALANLEWATRIATAWSTDAHIWDFEISGLRADGTVDLTSRQDFEAVYDFISPARRAAAVELGAVTEKTVPSGFSITVKQGRVWARVKSPSVAYLEETKNRPPITVGCTLGDIVQAALKDHLALRPFWMIEMTFDDKLGWSWVFDYDHDHPVRALDCTIGKTGEKSAVRK
jgi:hypothetical protein